MPLMISFRRPSVRLPLTPGVPDKTNHNQKLLTKKQLQLEISPELTLTISNEPGYRKHLAFIGDAEWVHYWQLDVLAYASEQRLRSFIITGPKDEALRAMPVALDLPDTLVNIREELSYSIDPATFRHRMDVFAQLNTEQDLAIMLAGRDLKHVWPFILGKKRDLKGKFTFGLADMTSNLKLPLSETFRYFLVQPTYQEQFKAAVERWHRHESIKPNYHEAYLKSHDCFIYEIKDSN